MTDNESLTLPDLIQVELASKGVSEEVASRLGIGMDDDGRVYFPYYDLETGKLVAAKVRSGLDRDFMWEGTAQKASFFGTNLITQVAKKVILTVGETDCAACNEAMRYDKYVMCLGIAKGDGSAKGIVQRNLAWLRSTFTTFYVAFDSDESGQSASADVVAMLPQGRTYVTTLPTGYKDVSELVVDNKDEFVTAYKASIRIIPSILADNNVLRTSVLDLAYNPRERLGASTGYVGLDYLIGGYGRGEVLTLAADTGVGKTKFSLQLAHNAIKNGEKVLFIPLEMRDEVVLLNLAEFDLKTKLISDEPPDLDPSIVQKSVDRLLESCHFVNHFGSLDVETLIEAIEVAVDAYGVTTVFLDHITGVSGGSGDTWKQLEGSIKALKEIALKKNIFILVVSHVTVPASEDENGDTELTLGHIRGSRSIAQWSDVVLLLMRDRASNVMRLKTGKIHRTLSRYGELFFTFEDNNFYEQTSPTLTKAQNRSKALKTGGNGGKDTT